MIERCGRLTPESSLCHFRSGVQTVMARWKSPMDIFSWWCAQTRYFKQVSVRRIQLHMGKIARLSKLGLQQ